MTNDQPAVHTTLTFRLGVCGTLITDRFAGRIESLRLKPKHVGVLTALRTGNPASQLELARQLGVAPSLMVSLADHLEQLGAIARVRDPGDRRRQVLTLTDTGRGLLSDCDTIASDMDGELAETLGGDDFRDTRDGLAKLAAEFGMPTQ